MFFRSNILRRNRRHRRDLCRTSGPCHPRGYQGWSFQKLYSNLEKSIDDFRVEYGVAYNQLIDKMDISQDKQNIRIDCLAQKISTCCKDGAIC